MVERKIVPPTRRARWLLVLAMVETFAGFGVSMARSGGTSGACETGNVVAKSEHSPPRRCDVEAWLGVYQAGRETLTLRWSGGGLVIDLDRISVPVDGRWHETVPTFAVRHRVGWVAERRVLTLEEQHNEGVHWRYELRISEGRLDKVQMPDPTGGEETLVRSYRRKP